jgi:hypothetical protein
MIKTIFCKLFLIGLVIGFTLNSCSKKDFDQHTDPSLKSTITYGLDISPAANTQDLSGLISNTIDTSERRMNYYYYYLALCMDELVKDGSFNEYVVSLAQQSPNQVANFNTIYNSSLAYKAIIDDTLDHYNVTFGEICDNFTYNNGNIHETYVPGIFVPNADRADSKKQPIFSPNIEVDCSENSIYEDFIVAWYFTENGEKIEVMLSENNSLNTSNPIFLLDNAEISAVKKNGAILPPEEPPLKSVLTTHFDSYEYRANYNYEPWPGRTEFTIVAYRIDPQGVVHWIYNSGGWMEINKIQRSEIGDDLTKWVLHSANYTPYNNNYVYWNTYERDWNRSDKWLGNATENGTTIHLYGRMHHGNEWYAWDPGSLQDHNTDFQYIYTYGSKMYENSKTKYKIHLQN